MGASPHFVAGILALLAADFDKQPEEVQKDRKRLAKAVYRLRDTAGCDGDFNDDDIGMYDEMVVLGVAKRCKRCGRGYTPWNEDEHGNPNGYGNDCNEDE